MATRIMIDTIHANVPAVKKQFPNPQMVAYYRTGSTDIQWTDADVAEFQGAVMVSIDQGGQGSHVADAMVRDVEPGAWTPQGAVNLANWHTPRPTIYCDRADLPRVIAAGWRKDVWLAWPGYAASGPPSEPGVNIVAVQNVFGADHDSSLVFDPTWPHIVIPPSPPPTLSVTVTDRQADMAWPVAVGADHYDIDYTPEGSALTVTIGRPPQSKTGGSVHALNVVIPGARGGAIQVFAIISSKRHLIGSVHLP